MDPCILIRCACTSSCPSDEDRFPEPEKRIPSGTEQRTPTGQKPGGWLPHALPASSDTGDEDEVPFTDNRKQLKSIKTKPSASPALNHSPSLPQRKEKKARPALQVSGGDPQSPGYNDYSSGEFNTSDDDLDTPGQVPFPPAEDQHCKPSAAVRPRPSRSFNTVRPDEPDNDGFGGRAGKSRFKQHISTAATAAKLWPRQQ